ncbi:MAG: type II toxin-antitoxin system prevent-host-death family antitoxin [Proteobacteria bacterium]|nr:type II toxin-antitoxin system prevent-host-death family antitoxin [Pseudomonadota bacterium]
MRMSVIDAKTQLTDLMKRAEPGDDVVLAPRGHPVARIVPVGREKAPAERWLIMESISRRAAAKATPGPCTARSQEHLYDDHGLSVAGALLLSITRRRGQSGARDRRTIV